MKSLGIQTLSCQYLYEYQDLFVCKFPVAALALGAPDDASFGEAGSDGFDGTL